MLGEKHVLIKFQDIHMWLLTLKSLEPNGLHLLFT